MKIILAAFFLISTALTYPVGDSNESKSSVAVINPNSFAKSEESGEIHDHDHAHKVVSHEHKKEIQQDSSETSEESSESNEKPEKKPQLNEPTPIPQVQKAEQEEKVLDAQEKSQISVSESQVSEVVKEEKTEEPVAALEKNEEPLSDEKSFVEPEAPALKSLGEEKIDIIEAVNKPAAIAEESPASEEKLVKTSEVKINEKPLALPDSISEEKSIAQGKEIDENPIEKENAVISQIVPEIKDEVPKKIEVSKDELKQEGKSEPDDVQHELKKDEIVKTDLKESSSILNSEVKEALHKEDDISAKKEESVKVLGKDELSAISEQSPSKSVDSSS